MASCHLADYFGTMEAWGGAEKDCGAEVPWSRELLVVKKLDRGRDAAVAISSQIVPLTYIGWCCFMSLELQKSKFLI